MLLKEGLDFKYGARHLKRAVERFLVYPLSNLVATGQIGLGDLVHVDLDEYTHKLIFSKSSGGALIQELPKGKEEPEAVESCQAASGCRYRRRQKRRRKAKAAAKRLKARSLQLTN